MGDHFTSYQNIFKILHVICPCMQFIFPGLPFSLIFPIFPLKLVKADA
uniref:Uncharacterized protein n=1 Tax=Arundo donax TaxID=35708 RepID=A0A0A9FQR1_ARUDO